MVDILDLKYNAGSTKGYTVPPGVSENVDNKVMLKSLLPKEVKVSFTIDDLRLKSRLTTSQTIRCTKKTYFYTNLGFIQSHSRVLGDIKVYIQLIPGTNESDIIPNVAGINKNHLKCHCILSSIVNGLPEPFLYSFSLDKPPCH